MSLSPRIGLWPGMETFNAIDWLFDTNHEFWLVLMELFLCIIFISVGPQEMMHTPKLIVLRATFRSHCPSCLETPSTSQMGVSGEKMEDKFSFDRLDTFSANLFRKFSVITVWKRLFWWMPTVEVLMICYWYFAMFNE